MPKRKSEAEDDQAATPARKARSVANATTTSPVATPSRKKSILRNTPSKAHGDEASEAEPTPRSLKRVLFSTPSHPVEELAEEPEESTTPSKRKPTSTRKPRGKRGSAKQNGDTQLDSSDGLVQEVVRLNEADAIDNSEDEEIVAVSAAAPSPSKRGRPKGRRRERTPSPPPDLPPHELYFFHHRAVRNETSTNTLPTNLLLNHEDYFAQISAFHDPHEDDIKALAAYHHRAFDQWVFELAEGFNVCLYGYGSKRALLIEFAEHLSQRSEREPKIVIVNGYAPGLTLRDILVSAAGVVAPKTKLPIQPAAALEMLLSFLDQLPPAQSLTLMINSIDHANLRKSSNQPLLARLASHKSISVLASCDNPNFPLLWDATQQRQFRWLYHDATTFVPYSAEIEVVEEVNALLGRSTRRLGGKDGVAYVLRSLPENAQTLFRILIVEQLASGVDVTLGNEDDNESILGIDDEDEAAAAANTPSRRARGKKNKPVKNIPPPSSASEGVEYRTLYHKAVEEFVCSSEVGFRTLLKEFHDHQMIESRKDGMGTERLVVPFRREELEEVLNELV